MESSPAALAPNSGGAFDGPAPSSDRQGRETIPQRLSSDTRSRRWRSVSSRKEVNVRRSSCRSAHGSNEDRVLVFASLACRRHRR
jgi:hypothetical protein